MHLEGTLVFVGIFISLGIIIFETIFSTNPMLVVIGGLIGVCCGGYFYYRMDHPRPFHKKQSCGSVES